MKTSVRSRAPLPVEGGAEAGRARSRPCATPAGAVPDREVAGAARGHRPAHRPGDLGLPSVRGGRAAARADLRRAPGAPTGRGDRRHPLRDALEPVRRQLPRRALARAREAGETEAERTFRSRSRRAGIHVERAALTAPGGRVAGRLRGRRRAADARARLAAPPRRPATLLLEEREVAPRARADAHGSPRLLGALRLPQRRRLLERAAVWVLRSDLQSSSNEGERQ